MPGLRRMPIGGSIPACAGEADPDDPEGIEPAVDPRVRGGSVVGA